MPDEPVVEHRKVVCEFCGCQVSGRGEVLSMSERAKELRKAEDRADRLQATVTERDGEITTLQAEIADVRAQLEAARKANGDDEDEDEEAESW